MQMIDDKGRPVTLGRELGRGGEGTVYDVVGRPDRVAKIYTKTMPPDLADKLGAMAKMASASLLRIAALPTDVLRHPSGSLAGFIMPKVAGHEPVFKVYGPKLRLKEFPTADWRFLIHVASNTARAFATVHAASLVVGDVNHGNLVVNQDATVRMIDCDSFQLTQRGKTWFCEVGVETHQPPEMQNRDSYRGILRTTNNDNFGLAVIIFQLLCVARHPFSGVYLGKGDPPSIGAAIASSRYAYSQAQSRTAMKPPPGSLPIDALTPTLQRLFEEAFSPNNTKQGRPNAQQWVAALDELSKNLMVCSRNQGHYFRKGYPSCPWCSIESSSGVTLFPAVFPRSTGQAKPDAWVPLLLWQEISKISPPPSLGPFPHLPVRNAQPSVASAGQPKDQAVLRVVSILSSIASMVVCHEALSGWVSFIVPAGMFVVFSALYKRGTDPARKAFDQDVKRFHAEWNRLKIEWKKPSSMREFSNLKTSLLQIKDQFEKLDVEKSRRLQLLHEECRKRLAEAFLARFDIASAKISGIGPQKKSALANYGILNASDISAQRVMTVPGFGQAMTSRLTSWRAQCESAFRFIPLHDVPRHDIAVIEQDVRAKKATLEVRASEGLRTFKVMAEKTATANKVLQLNVQQVGDALAQAKADARACPRNPRSYKQIIALSFCSGLFSLGGLARQAPPSGASRTSASVKGYPPISQVVRQMSDEQSASKTTDQLAKAALNSSNAENRTPLSCPSSSGSKRNVVMMQGANIHMWPNGPNAGIAAQGTHYTVCGEQGRWTEIGTNRPLGWVYTPLTGPE